MCQCHRLNELASKPSGYQGVISPEIGLFALIKDTVLALIVFTSHFSSSPKETKHFLMPFNYWENKSKAEKTADIHFLLKEDAKLKDKDVVQAQPQMKPIRFNLVFF